MEKIIAAEIDDMTLMLAEHGYADPGAKAKALSGEGMGPEELRHILRTTTHGECGSLEYTHAFRRLTVEDMTHKQRIWSELMKLPKTVLRAMALAPQSEHDVPMSALSIVLPRGVTITTASTDDLARALAEVLARRDFMRQAHADALTIGELTETIDNGSILTIYKREQDAEPYHVESVQRGQTHIAEATSLTTAIGHTWSGATRRIG